MQPSLRLRLVPTLFLLTLLLSSPPLTSRARAQGTGDNADEAAEEDLSTYILMVDDNADAEAVSASIRAVASDGTIAWRGKVKRTHPRISTIIIEGTAGTCKKLRETLAEITYCEADSRVSAA